MRTFVAIDFDLPVRRAIARCQNELRAAGLTDGLRWTPPEHVHLTLQFLGETSDRQVAEIGAALDRLAAANPAFELSIGGIGRYPPRRSVRIVWMGVRDESGVLARCHQACQVLLQPLGFVPEARAYSPHLTIARVNNPRVSGLVADIIAGAKPCPATAQAVDHVTFYQSNPGDMASRYVSLSRHPLNGLV